jgi:uncharacterized membrane protein
VSSFAESDQRRADGVRPRNVNGRLEAFSDGVFAVAITLLALGLKVGSPGEGSLVHQIADQWPSFAAYVVSFFSIGIVWVNHHALFKSLRREDNSRGLMFFNLVLLLFVVLIPFATATMAAYVRAGGTDAHVAAAIYGAVMEGMGLSFGAVFLWCTRRTGFAAPLPPRAVRAAAVRFGLGTFFYAVAIAIAFLSAPIALAVNAAIALYYVFEQTPRGDELQAADRRDDAAQQEELPPSW